MKCWAAIAVGLSLAPIGGCSPTETPRATAVSADVGRAPEFSLRTEERSATLLVTRDTGTYGGGCDLTISVDGRSAANLAAGETVTLFVAPGEHVLRAAKSVGGLCYIDPGATSTQETVIGKGQAKTYRATIDFNGRAIIQRTET